MGRHVVPGDLLAHQCVKRVRHIGRQRGNGVRQEQLEVRLRIWALRSDTSGSLGNIFNDPLALSSTLLRHNTSHARERSLQRRQNPDRKAGLGRYIIWTGLPTTVRTSLVDWST